MCFVITLFAFKLILLLYKLPIYRPGSPLGLQNVEISKICRESAHEGGEVINPRHRQPLPTPPRRVDVERQ